MSYFVKCYIVQPTNCKRWLILGKTKEYLVTKDSCTCRDFLTKLLKKEQSKCKHILLFLSALETKEFDTYEITISEYRELRPYLLELKK